MTSSLAPSSNQEQREGTLSWRWRVLTIVISWFAFLLAKTFRVKVIGPEIADDRPRIFTFHHGRQLGLLRFPRPEKVVVLSSLSHDGSLQARILSRLGFTVVRGSSTRGGAEGLAALIRAVRRGASAALAVDGPKGPPGVVKPGAVFAARATDSVIVPVSCAASRAFVLGKSWDRFLIPAPWSRVVLLIGEPFEIPRRAGETALEAARERLERELETLTARAEELLSAGKNDSNENKRKKRIECLG